jgi:putative membrane protein
MNRLLATASALALFVAAPAWAQNAANPGAGQPLSQQDKIFVQKAGDGSLAEAELGRLAMQKGGTPAVREFGRWMYTDHGLVANNWLKAILAAQNETAQPKLTAQDQEMRRRLEGMSGAQFDREYTQGMVADHEKTIPVFETEARDGQNPMIKNFAASLIPVLQQHLAEVKLLAGETGMATRRGGVSGEGSGSSIQR